MAIKTFKGAKPYIQHSARIFESIKATLEKISNDNGFDSCFTSLVDDKSLYVDTLGEGSDVVNKEMFELKYKNYVLRPEGTANVMQYVIKDSLHLNEMPLKIYYIGPMFRHERPQKGRYRQFWQYGVEYINNYQHPVQEVDVLKICEEFVAKYNLKQDLELNINTIGSSSDRTRYSQHIIEYFANKPALKNELSIESQQKLAKNPIRILDSKSETDQKIINGLKSLNYFISTDSKAYFQNVIDLLESQNIKYTLNNKLVRGLDYYNDFCFEYLIKEQGHRSQNAIIAGGRYNKLPNKITGNDKLKLYSFGFALGIDRLIDNLGHKIVIDNPSKPRIGLGIVLECDDLANLKIYSYANDIETILKDIYTLDRYYILDHDFKKAFKYYEGKRVSSLVIIGENEINSNRVEIRNLDSKTQKPCKPDEMLHEIRIIAS